LELHGNYVWNPGTKLFGAMLSTSNEQKQDDIRKALSTLTDDHLTPFNKAEKISELSGFGPGTATGLVMLAHPTEFAIWNQASKAAFKKVGVQASGLAHFQDAARTLRDRLKADDFLQLDWFLYLANEGWIDVPGLNQREAASHKPPPPGVRYWVMS